MNAIIYFFTTLGVHNFILALLSFLLGVLLGWLIWARRSKGPDFSVQYEAEKKKTADLEAQLKNCKKARTDLEGKLEKAKGASVDTSGLEADLKASNTKVSDLEAKLSGLQASANTANASNADLDAANSKIADLEAQLSSANSDLSACRTDLDACRAEQSEPVVEQPAIDPNDESPEGLKAKNMAFFADDLASGRLVEDEKYGLLYTQAVDADEADDLTRIKGVAGVLNKTLNEYGVYKFRQIALWTPQICEDFSEKIAFKGRVERDNWIDQCKEFHFEKYGEKI